MRLFRNILTVFLFISVFSLFAAPKPALFPPDFPQELSKLKLREKEVRQLAPGVTYYHYHFDNVLPSDKLPIYRLTKVFVPKKANATEAPSSLTDFLKRVKDVKKSANIPKMLKGNEKGLRNQAVTFFGKNTAAEDPVEKAARKLKKPGDLSAVGSTEKEWFFLRLDNVVKQMPVSVYYVVIDWNTAKVKVKLAECGPILKTVKDMVKDYDPLCAVNGAYFKFVPPKTFYPLKIDGKMYEPDPGYDSHDGMCFKDGEYPVLDKQENFDQYDNVIMGYRVWSKGKFALDNKVEHWTGIAQGDTPLTAVGFNYEKKLLVLFTSDGRFPQDAPGLNFYGESYFVSLMGCDEVLSIDGGGSCTMLIREGKKLSDPKNHPSDNRKFDHEGARSVQNCIYVVENNDKKD